MDGNKKSDFRTLAGLDGFKQKKAARNLRRGVEEREMKNEKGLSPQPTCAKLPATVLVNRYFPFI
jgi:hypothetical protein